MIEQKIQQIKAAVRDLIQKIIDKGEEPPPEVKEMLLQVLEKLKVKLTELRKQQQQEEQQAELEQAESEQAQVASELGPPVEAPQITGEPVPPLAPAPFPSSNINAFRYEPKSQKLFVKFQDKYPQQNGPIYAYEGVPQYIAEVFARGAVAPKTSGKNKWHRWQKGVTPSHGAAMYALIKSGAFPYSRIR